ncbi:uncharacterized protein EV422DRAFT_178511 [Fimicolochytrium jonesii]|uniref:uncharacterized protein n=1 Tax=Fimicolochytrium jonesii TaxID=1396493 RepID=UPI0022FF3A4C|nr:uncharacterized protein EV422DRAFT_178511 [Fimicolochytrium jonesii]KAI8818300.1 hypothetical protein EV422DRAFT_178511 [Fimicolochytrium jonesii]
MAPPSQKKQQLPQAGKPPPATDTPTSASQDEHPNPNSDEPPDSVNINPNNNTNDDDDSETQSLLSSRPTNTTPLIPPPLPPHGHDDDDTPTTSLSTIQIINLNAFWFGYQLLWFLVFVVVVPAQVAEIAGPQGKGRALSAVSLCGGILNLGLAVLVGAFNDRSSGGKFGKRWVNADGDERSEACFKLMQASPRRALVRSGRPSEARST